MRLDLTRLRNLVHQMTGIVRNYEGAASAELHQLLGEAQGILGDLGHAIPEDAHAIATRAIGVVSEAERIFTHRADVVRRLGAIRTALEAELERLRNLDFSGLGGMLQTIGGEISGLGTDLSAGEVPAQTA